MRLWQEMLGCQWVVMSGELQVAGCFVENLELAV
jgi:hypothetical protein